MNFKNLLAKIALIVLVGSMVALPMVSSAAQDSSGNNVAYTAPSLWPTGFWGPLTWCTGNYLSPNSGTNGITSAQVTVNGQQPPACTSLCDLIGTIINVIYFVMSLAIFIITPVSLLVGAIMVMVSGANPEMLGRGKKILMSTVIGLAIILCSYLLIATVISVLGITGIGGFGTSAC